MTINAETALLELTVINAETQPLTFIEAAKDMLDRGLPPEVVTRLEDLWAKTKVIGGEIVAVGKIIVKRIVDFLLANPGVAVGLAIGGAVAAIVSSTIPFIGSMLTPLILVLSTVYSYNIQDGGRDSLLHSTYKLAQEFFKMLLEIFQAVVAFVKA